MAESAWKSEQAFVTEWISWLREVRAMQIAGVAKQLNETNLKLLKQLGVDDFVYYSMQGMPNTLEELTATKDLIENCGLRLAVIEGGPPIDQIVLGQGRSRPTNPPIHPIDSTHGTIRDPSLML